MPETTEIVVETILCYDCGRSVDRLDAREGINYSRNYRFCDECYWERYAVCDDCGEVDDQNNTHWVNDRTICGNCLEDNNTRCEQCYEWYSNDENWEGVQGAVFCQNCVDNYTTWCERCEARHMNRERCDRSGLAEYNYRPDFTRHDMGFEDKGPTYGIEIEVECTGDFNPDDVADLVTESRDSEWIYVKDDGSLDNGAELVTMPLTLPWLRANGKKLSKILTALKGEGVRSYKTETCGIHIHVDSTEFKKHPLWGFKFQTFFYNNRGFSFIVSQRIQSELNQWASLTTEGRRSLIRKAKGDYGDGGRYVAVNTDQPFTYEVRIFRGTLLFPSVMKNVEFVDAVRAFSENHGISDMTQDKFVEWLDHKEYPNLSKFLATKGFGVEAWKKENRRLNNKRTRQECA